MIRTLLIMLVTGSCVFAAWMIILSQFFVFNASWSAPHWGYVRLPDTLKITPYHVGDWIQFQPNLDTPWPYIKQIVGQAGDEIEVDENRNVSVAGKLIGQAKKRARTGRPVAPIASGIIPQGYVFVAGLHKDSHDSRYAEIGLINISSLLGKLWVLPDLPMFGLMGSKWIVELQEAHS